VETGRGGFLGKILEGTRRMGWKEGFVKRVWRQGTNSKRGKGGWKEKTVKKDGGELDEYGEKESKSRNERGEHTGRHRVGWWGNGKRPVLILREVCRWGGVICSAMPGKKWVKGSLAKFGGGGWGRWQTEGARKLCQGGKK